MLHDSAEKYRNIFLFLPVSVQVVDEKGLIVEVNPFHVNHIGRGKTTTVDYLGKYIYDRPSIVGAGLADKYRKVLEGAPFRADEVYFPSTTGGISAYYNVRGEPIIRDNRITGAIFIIEDVTGLKETERELRRYQEQLETMVAERTLALDEANRELSLENAERKRAEAEKELLIGELRDALKKVRTLSGFLPICASCKKIRDDQGYWKQIEAYIQEHSDALFSHSICPECLDRLYPEFRDNPKE